MTVPVVGREVPPRCGDLVRVASQEPCALACRESPSRTPQFYSVRACCARVRRVRALEMRRCVTEARFFRLRGPKSRRADRDALTLGLWSRSALPAARIRTELRRTPVQDMPKIT